MKRGGAYLPTVVQLPSRPSNEYTVQARKRAIDAASGGILYPMADLTKAALTESGTNSGLVNGLVHTILGLPLTFQGDPEQVAALTDTENTLGDYGAMFPEGDASKVFKSGIISGLGLGQMIEPDGIRPVGTRHVPRMRAWDIRWLRQQPYDRTWHLMTQTGEIEIHPGDGEWVLFTPYGEVDPWEDAPWKYLTLAFTLARDAIFDRGRHSQVLAPVRVMRATKPTTKEERRKGLAKLEKMARDNYFMLPEQWLYEVVGQSGQFTDVYAKIVEWARQEVEIGLTGTVVTTEGNQGFSEGSLHFRGARERAAFFARAWLRTCREQSLVWWSAENYASRNPPVGHYQVEPPEDLLARAESLDAYGKSLKSVNEGLATMGLQRDPTCVIEEGQKRGMRIIPLAKPAPLPTAPGVSNDTEAA